MNEEKGSIVPNGLGVYEVADIKVQMFGLCTKVK